MDSGKIKGERIIQCTSHVLLSSTHRVMSEIRITVIAIESRHDSRVVINRGSKMHEMDLLNESSSVPIKFYTVACCRPTELSHDIPWIPPCDV